MVNETNKKDFELKIEWSLTAMLTTRTWTINCDGMLTIRNNKGCTGLHLSLWSNDTYTQ